MKYTSQLDNKLSFNQKLIADDPFDKLHNAKETNILKPMESPFTAFCKGLSLSPAPVSFASPYNFAMLSYRPK